MTDPHSGGAEAAADTSVDAANVRWEIGLYRILTGLIIAAAVMLLTIAPAIGSDLALPEVALCGLAVLYFAALWQVVKRTRERWLRGIRLMSATVETSFGTLAIALATAIKGPEWATTSPTMLIHVLAIVASSIRARPAITLYCAVLACAQWLLLYYLYLRPHLGGAAIPTAHAWAAWERCFWLLLIGGVAAFATLHVRTTALFAVFNARQRMRVHREAGRFLSAEGARRMLDGRARTGQVERCDLSVLFCDLRDFTALCERERPGDVIALLNDFYERACAAVVRRGGQVNKFLGDGLLALFDASAPEGAHADAALAAARDLVDIADALRLRGGIGGDLSIGVGLDTGPVLLGTVGASERLEFTAIGATVNRAARLQALARPGGRSIILSRACVDALRISAGVDAFGRERIKGISAPVEVYCA
ncbi:MAG TPA: adenylate/guanylate cyclase domain-containing protein [Kofleriaceae bacterium]|nr:adenylate/guanylate cyclase domain-containing protein [Kofleriaceae bacterium]